MGRYQIIGADGRQYGPVSGEQLRQWIAEGRANAQTYAYAEGTAEWKPLGTLPEFAGHFTSAAPPPISPPTFRPARKTNPYAIIGMIFGILSMTCCCAFPFGVPLFVLLGIVFSTVGLAQISRHPELYEGRSQALAGLVLSLASLLLIAGFFLWSLVTGNFHGSFNGTKFTL